MSLVRWDPFRDLLSMQDRMNRLFSDVFGRTTGEEATGAWLPAVDIYEEGDNLILQAEVPGVAKNDLDVRVENNVLTLSGERRQQKEVRDEQFHRLERAYGKFVRSFTLPVGIDTDKIKAEFRDGLLTLTLPKVEEAKPKRIKVLAA
jgi:HSP20 family protein